MNKLQRNINPNTKILYKQSSYENTFLQTYDNPISGIQSVNKMLSILFCTHWANKKWLYYLLQDFMGNDWKYVTKDADPLILPEFT